MSPRVSIVIPTWNKRVLLQECLRSILLQTFSSYEVVIVDDGSTEDIRTAALQVMPSASVTRLDANSGFCVATNTGIRAARGELILLLNNDMTIEPAFLERLVDAVDASPAAMFAPLILWRDDPETIYGAGDRMLTNGRPESIGFRRRRSELTHPKRIFGVSGGAALIRRSVFDRIGLLDETFVSYFEDADFCFRARLAGFDAQLAPEAIAYHVGSASIAGATWRRSRQCYRNHALLVIKNMPTRFMFQYGFQIASERVHQARMLFSAARASLGAVRALGILFGAWLSLWAAAPHAIRQRITIQRSRQRSDDDIADLLSKM